MKPSKLSKTERKGEETRTALIEAGETLFAQYGINGVSLRQIGAAIGSQNSNVVGYHFGTMEGLIEAIYQYRLPTIEARRRELLEIAERKGMSHDARTLITTMWRPLFEQKNTQGHHSYARFLASISRDGFAYTRHALDRFYPTTNEINSRIAALTGASAASVLKIRMRMLAFMVFGALEFIDQNCKNDAEAGQIVFDETTSMAARALVTSECTSGHSHTSIP